jgi:aspartate--ammonia ligase
MSKSCIPEGYTPALSLYETQTAIGLIKFIFEQNLSAALNLKRVSAPLFVEPNTGLNDDLDGVQRPVSFDIKTMGKNAQIVQSLAKWKRAALKNYGFPVGEGLYTDMNGIRPDEPDRDNLHSVYVDQWDWEVVIERGQRTADALKSAVRKIVGAICDTQDELTGLFPALAGRLSREVAFVTAQELEDKYPGLTPEEREHEFVKGRPTTFILGIGGPMKSGQWHGSRSPDYDDWSLNGDIIFWNEMLRRPIELSSMGIRVDAGTLDRQLAMAGCDHRRVLTYHKMLLGGQLPLTMGGGIGQSRLCMLLLRKAHIGEVQVSVWDEETVNLCKKAGVPLL